MKVLFVGATYDYGSRDRGRSYEYYNLFQVLERLVDQVVIFDVIERQNELGREGMNTELLSTVDQLRPDLVFVVPFTDELSTESLDRIKAATVSIAYFFDDPWRVAYVHRWAPHFTYVTTSDVNGLRRFEAAGHRNAIYSPFGCNSDVFHRKSLPMVHDVSFVGQFHPVRAWYLRHLTRAGLRVRAWGHGWPDGRLTQDQMVDVFNQSRINLNLTNCISFDVRYLAEVRRPMVETARAWRGVWNALRHPDPKLQEQVKGRHFEINACGGFQLSYYVEGLERHYVIGDELVVYSSPAEMVERVRFYLQHEDERAVIAARGYQKTIAEHLMSARFQRLFEQVGLRAMAGRL